MNNMYKATISAESEEDFSYKVTDILSKFATDLALNHQCDMLLIQFKEAEQYVIAEYVDNFRRIDNQYVYHGEFKYREEIEKIVKPFCKELCISIVPKGKQAKQGEHIDEKSQYGYLTLINIIPFSSNI